LRTAYSRHSLQKDIALTILAAQKARPEDKLQQHLNEFISTTRLPPPPDRKARLRIHGYKVGNTRTNAEANYRTIEDINEDLRPFGVQFIANDRVFHIYEDWPGMDRRLVSGSVWDGRAPLSNAAWQGVIRCAHEDWEAAQRQLAAWRGMQLLRHGGIGAAWLDDGAAGHALRFLKEQGHDIGAPVPRSGQCLIHRASLRGGRGLDYDNAMARLGGPTKEEQALFTHNKATINAEIMRQRDLHHEFVRRCEALEDTPRKLAEYLLSLVDAWDESNRHSKYGFDWDLVHPRIRPLADGRLIQRGSDHDQGGHHLIPECLLDNEDDLPAWRPPKRKLVFTSGPASECKRLDPATPIELRAPKRGSIWKDKDGKVPLGRFSTRWSVFTAATPSTRPRTSFARLFHPAPFATPTPRRSCPASCALPTSVSSRRRHRATSSSTATYFAWSRHSIPSTSSPPV
jgi:hypothetical protein